MDYTASQMETTILPLLSDMPAGMSLMVRNSGPFMASEISYTQKAPTTNAPVFWTVALLPPILPISAPTGAACARQPLLNVADKSPSGPHSHRVSDVVLAASLPDSDEGSCQYQVPDAMKRSLREGPT